MGKRDKRKDKKKGKGAEKTAMKTEKKAAQKLKKELKVKGEDDIQELIAQIREKDRKILATSVQLTEPPSRRSNFTLTANADKDELILFGGEYFNGSKTEMYNDLYVYKIKKNEWTLIKCPESPTPRSSHQAVYVSQAGGQLWVFGGEFDSPSQSQFHHYKDLWVFHFQSLKWDKIASPGAPTARSGHRMVAVKKRLFIFGGFHDNLREYKSFNDVYSFNLETYEWHMLETSGTPPSPRSACQMVALLDGRLLIYGGYSKEKVKKDVDKGIVHHDMFYLQPDKNDETLRKWKWLSVKQSGLKPSPRCGFSIVATGNDRAILFGGVYDEDSEDNLTGEFYGDLYQLELDKGKWFPMKLSGKKAAQEKSGKESEETEALDMLALEEKSVKTFDDGIFTVTMGTSQMEASTSATAGTSKVLGQFSPHGRMNPGLTFKKGLLYLYGGTCEQDEKQLTFADFYSLDVHKLQCWETIIPDDIQKQEWINSESSSEGSSDEEGEDMDEESESDEDDSDEMDLNE